MEDLIVSRSSEGNWPGCVAAVKANDRTCTGDVRLLIDYSLLSAEIPLKLIVRAPAGHTIVAHSEIRDLGEVNGTKIAGMSNTVVAPGYRHHGIYTALIKLRNMILDRGSFDCVVGRVKMGYEDRYMAQYSPQFPGFTCVKKEDAYGAAWVLRPIYYCAPLEMKELKPIIKYLETEVKKW